MSFASFTLASFVLFAASCSNPSPPSDHPEVRLRLNLDLVLAALRLVPAADRPRARPEVERPAGRQPGQGQGVGLLVQRVGCRLGIDARRCAPTHLAGGELIRCPTDGGRVALAATGDGADLRRRGVADQGLGIASSGVAQGLLLAAPKTTRGRTALNRVFRHAVRQGEIIISTGVGELEGDCVIGRDRARCWSRAGR